jgi:hypothetical protein
MSHVAGAFRDHAVSLGREYIPSKWLIFYPAKWDWDALSESFVFFYLFIYLFMRARTGARKGNSADDLNNPRAAG